MSTKQKKKNKGGGIKERNPYKLRNGHKAYATKLISETKELLNESSPEVREKLKILTISLNEILQKIADLDEEILDQVDSEEEIAEEIETAGSFRAGMHEVVVKIDDLLISTSQRPQRSDTNVEKVVSTKLPKLELRKFKADPKEWITFWERFSSAVDDNPTISDVDKFNYLKGLLEGSALTTVDSLPLTSTNYQSAVKLLEQRYGNKQVIINSHMESLLNLTAAGSGDI